MTLEMLNDSRHAGCEGQMVWMRVGERHQRRSTCLALYQLACSMAGMR